MRPNLTVLSLQIIFFSKQRQNVKITTACMDIESSFKYTKLFTVL